MSFMLFGKGHSLQTAFGWHEGIGTPSLTRAGVGSVGEGWC